MGSPASDPGHSFQWQLRPYQLVGMHGSICSHRLRLEPVSPTTWAWARPSVLSLLLVLKDQAQQKRKPCHACGASLPTRHWPKRFLASPPSLRVFVAHPSATPAEKLTNGGSDRWEHVDLVVTSYGFLAPVGMGFDHSVELRFSTRRRRSESWRQTDSGGEAAPSRCSHCPNGTPVENRLGDLWSIFDFINPRTFGSSKDFGVIYQAASRAVRKTPRPPAQRSGASFILRRLRPTRASLPIC